MPGFNSLTPTLSRREREKGRGNAGFNPLSLRERVRVRGSSTPQEANKGG